MKDRASATPKSGKQKFYGVAVGHVPGVYTEWSAVQAQIKGIGGCKHKSFATQAEALAFVNEFKRDKSAPISLRGDLSEASSATDKHSKVGENTSNTSKRQKKEDTAPASTLTNGHTKFEPGMGPLPPDAEDGFDRTIKLDINSGHIRAKTSDELRATKSQPTGDFTGPITVYTDGSSLNNGKAHAVGGVGVYFGPHDPRNVSEALRGDRQTNQRAELTAVARALDHIPIHRDACIVTDSNYAIKCLTLWSRKWATNGWRNAAGKPVENKDLIEPIVAWIRERGLAKAKTEFRWVKGHANDAGNAAADELAVKGSRYSTPELRGAREFSVTLSTPGRGLVERSAEKRDSLGTVIGELGDEEDEDFEEIFAQLAKEREGGGG